MSWSKILTIGASVISFPISIISAWYTRKQYLSAIRPELQTNGYTREGNMPLIDFCIENKGKNARIEKVTPLTKNIKIGNNGLPITLEQDKDMFIRVVYQKDIREMKKDTIKIKIKYKDKENNSYTSKLLCVRGVSRIK